MFIVQKIIFTSLFLFKSCYCDTAGKLSLQLGWELALNINFISPSEGNCVALKIPVEVQVALEYVEDVQELIQVDSFQICFSLNGGEASCVGLATPEKMVLAGLETGCYQLTAWWEDWHQGVTGLSNAVQFEIANTEGICHSGGCAEASLACSGGYCTAYYVGMTAEPHELKMGIGPKIRVVSPLEGEIVGHGQVVFGVELSDPALVLEQNHVVCYRISEESGTTHESCVDHANPVWAEDLASGNYSIQTSLLSLQDGVHVEVATSDQVPFSVTEEQFDVAAYRRREGFRHIYVGGHWTGAGGRSGPGSTVATSRSDRAMILHTLLSTGATSLFDAGCGSLHWQPLLFQDYTRLSNQRLNFHGSDIVPDIIAKHQHAYSQHHNPHLAASFSTTDIAKDPIPQGYEVILCRHVLFHNTNDAILRALEGFAQSGAQYLLATTLLFIDPEQKDSSVLHTLVNAEMTIGTDGRALDFGGYRPICLQAEPFNFPAPLMFHHDNIELPEELNEFQQVLALWRLPL